MLSCSPNVVDEVQVCLTQSWLSEVQCLQEHPCPRDVRMHWIQAAEAKIKIFLHPVPLLRAPISLPSLSTWCSPTPLPGYSPLLSGCLLINVLLWTFLGRDAHAANYMSNAVTAATTNKPNYPTGATAGLCREGNGMLANHHASPPWPPFLQPKTLPANLYTSFYPIIPE